MSTELQESDQVAITTLNGSPMIGRALRCTSGAGEGHVARVLWAQADAPDAIWCVWVDDGNEAIPFRVTQPEFAANWVADFSWDMG